MGMITKMRFFWAALIVVIVIFGVFMLRNSQENYEAQDITPPEESIIEEETIEEETNPDPEEEIEITTEEPSGISIQELALHKNEDSCWIVFEGKVYDIASYLPRHPGGKSKILNTCGDPDKFEIDFADQHGTSRVSLLMKVGVLIGDFDVMGDLQG